MTHQHTDIGPCRFLTIDGLTIHLVEAGNGPAGVLVHGGQGWAYTWRHQFGPLAGAGYRVIAPDLPGSGYSDLTGSQASIEALSAFLGELLDALGIERAAFVANSAGGLPVLDLAIRHPARVAALVLGSTCGVPHTEPLLWRLLRWPLLGELMGLLVTPWMVRGNLRQAVYDETRITDDVVSAYHRPLRRPGAWRANLRLERNNCGGIRPMRSPSSFERVWGGRWPLWLLALLLLALAGCGGSPEAGRRELELASVSRLPKEIEAAPPLVREAYQFALANPDVLKFIPCYCGCGADHDSVKDCFVREVRPDGSAVFDDMGLG